MKSKNANDNGLYKSHATTLTSKKISRVVTPDGVEPNNNIISHINFNKKGTFDRTDEDKKFANGVNQKSVGEDSELWRYYSEGADAKIPDSSETGSKASSVIPRQPSRTPSRNRSNTSDSNHSGSHEKLQEKLNRLAVCSLQNNTGMVKAIVDDIHRNMKLKGSNEKQPQHRRKKRCENLSDQLSFTGAFSDSSSHIDLSTEAVDADHHAFQLGLLLSLQHTRYGYTMHDNLDSADERWIQALVGAGLTRTQAQALLFNEKHNVAHQQELESSYSTPQTRSRQSSIAKKSLTDIYQCDQSTYNSEFNVTSMEYSLSRSRSNSSVKQSIHRTSEIDRDLVKTFLNLPDDDDQAPQLIEQNLPNHSDKGIGIRRFLSRVIVDKLNQATPRRIQRTTSSIEPNRSPEFEVLHPRSATESSEVSYTMPSNIKKTRRHTEIFPLNQDIFADDAPNISQAASLHDDRRRNNTTWFQQSKNGSNGSSLSSDSFSRATDYYFKNIRTPPPSERNSEHNKALDEDSPKVFIENVCSSALRNHITNKVSPNNDRNSHVQQHPIFNQPKKVKQSDADKQRYFLGFPLDFETVTYINVKSADNKSPFDYEMVHHNPTLSSELNDDQLQSYRNDLTAERVSLPSVASYTYHPSGVMDLDCDLQDGDVHEFNHSPTHSVSFPNNHEVLSLSAVVTDYTFHDQPRQKFKLIDAWTNTEKGFVEAMCSFCFERMEMASRSRSESIEICESIASPASAYTGYSSIHVVVPSPDCFYDENDANKIEVRRELQSDFFLAFALSSTALSDVSSAVSERLTDFYGPEEANKDFNCLQSINSYKPQFQKEKIATEIITVQHYQPREFMVPQTTNEHFDFDLFDYNEEDMCSYSVFISEIYDTMSELHVAPGDVDHIPRSYFSGFLLNSQNFNRLEEESYLANMKVDSEESEYWRYYVSSTEFQLVEKGDTEAITKSSKACNKIASIIEIGDLTRWIPTYSAHVYFPSETMQTFFHDDADEADEWLDSQDIENGCEVINDTIFENALVVDFSCFFFLGFPLYMAAIEGLENLNTNASASANVKNDSVPFADASFIVGSSFVAVAALKSVMEMDETSNCYSSKEGRGSLLLKSDDVDFEEKLYEASGSEVPPNDGSLYFLGFAVHSLALEEITQAAQLTKTAAFEEIVTDGVVLSSPSCSTVTALLRRLQGPAAVSSFVSESQEHSNESEKTFEAFFGDLEFDQPRNFHLGFPLHQCALNSIKNTDVELPVIGEVIDFLSINSVDFAVSAMSMQYEELKSSRPKVSNVFLSFENDILRSVEFADNYIEPIGDEKIDEDETASSSFVDFFASAENLMANWAFVDDLVDLKSEMDESSANNVCNLNRCIQLMDPHMMFILGFPLLPLAFEKITEATHSMKNVVAAELTVTDEVFSSCLPCSVVCALRHLVGPVACQTNASESQEHSFEHEKSFEEILECDSFHDFKSRFVPLQNFFLGFPLHNSVLESISDLDVDGVVPASDHVAITESVDKGCAVSVMRLLLYEEWKSSQFEVVDNLKKDFGDVSQLVVYLDSVFEPVDDEESEDTISFSEFSDVLAAVVTAIVDAECSFSQVDDIVDLDFIASGYIEPAKEKDCISSEVDESSFANFKPESMMFFLAFPLLPLALEEISEVSYSMKNLLVLEMPVTDGVFTSFPPCSAVSALRQLQDPSLREKNASESQEHSFEHEKSFETIQLSVESKNESKLLNNSSVSVWKSEDETLDLEDFEMQPTEVATHVGEFEGAIQFSKEVEDLLRAIIAAVTDMEIAGKTSENEAVEAIGDETPQAEENNTDSVLDTQSLKMEPLDLQVNISTTAPLMYFLGFPLHPTALKEICECAYPLFPDVSSFDASFISTLSTCGKLWKDCDLVSNGYPNASDAERFATESPSKCAENQIEFLGELIEPFQCDNQTQPELEAVLNSRFYLGFPLSQTALLGIEQELPTPLNYPCDTVNNSSELQSFESLEQRTEPITAPLSSPSILQSAAVDLSIEADDYQCDPPEAKLLITLPDSSHDMLCASTVYDIDDDVTLIVVSPTNKVPIRSDSDSSFQSVLSHIESSAKNSCLSFKTTSTPSTSTSIIYPSRQVVAAVLLAVLLVLLYPFQLFYFNLYPINNPSPNPSIPSTSRRPFHFLSTPKLHIIIRNRQKLFHENSPPPIPPQNNTPWYHSLLPPMKFRPVIDIHSNESAMSFIFATIFLAEKTNANENVL